MTAQSVVAQRADENTLHLASVPLVPVGVNFDRRSDSPRDRESVEMCVLDSAAAA